MRALFPLALVLASGCSLLLPLSDLERDTAPTPDAATDRGVTRDSAPHDGAALDSRVVRDAPRDQQQLPDKLQPPDKLLPDTPLPLPDQTVPTVCIADSDCLLANNCCECGAYPANGKPPPACPLACVDPYCTDSWAIPYPTAQCVADQCIVASDASCMTDADCQVASNCCVCMALPGSAPTPLCARNCVIDTCVSLGLDKAVPSCVTGVCRLVLP